MRLPVAVLAAAAAAAAVAGPAPAAASTALTFAGTGVHYCESGLFGTSCQVSASSTIHCGGATAAAEVVCTVTLTASYAIPRTEPPSSNKTCGASGRGQVQVTDSLGTEYPVVATSFGGSGGAFAFHGVAGAAPDVTAVYGRFTISPLCGKQSGRLAGVVVRG